MRAGEGEPIPGEIEVTIDAAMPHHGHGMNVRPAVERSAKGHLSADGMLLHMPGYWEIYFDIRDGHITERAQAELTLR